MAKIEDVQSVHVDKWLSQVEVQVLVDALNVYAGTALYPGDRDIARELYHAVVRTAVEQGWG